MGRSSVEQVFPIFFQVENVGQTILIFRQQVVLELRPVYLADIYLLYHLLLTSALISRPVIPYLLLYLCVFGPSLVQQGPHDYIYICTYIVFNI